MSLTHFKLYEYEVTFIVADTINKNNLQKIFQNLFQYITKIGGVITDLQIAVKTSAKYNKNKIKKNQNSLIYSNLQKKYIYTINVKMNPSLLKEFIYNLKIRKITSNILCIKHIKGI